MTWKDHDANDNDDAAAAAGATRRQTVARLYGAYRTTPVADPL